eukprot:3841303-Amphidinium_carterae.1
MEGPFRLIVVSDAAFKPEENSKHARRGEILLLAPVSDSLGGRVHIMDYASKKIPRVTKSTYAAELHALCTGTDQAILLSSQYEQFFNNSWHGDLDSFEVQSRRGSLFVPVELAIDAWSVYLSLTSEDIKAPEERPLLLLLWHVRERMARGLIRAVHWVATQDMLADGLSKVSVSRDALLTLCRTGLWVLCKPSVQHVCQSVSLVSSLRHLQLA